MFQYEDDMNKIGEYLKKKIDEKYVSHRQFCKAYLKLKGVNPDQEEIRKLGNRLSQILNGKKRIQTHDLPYFSELLMISCEEILSCGKSKLPSGSHVTNYDIAYSKDREVWDRYMKREDHIFANLDEYNKSVIDYAIECENYEFIKYLLDNQFIWFVDHSKETDWVLGFGAGTSIDVNAVETGRKSNLPAKLWREDSLRTDVISMALARHDFETLDMLKAREIPWMGIDSLGLVGMEQKIYQQFYNQKVIDAISQADEQVLNYISEPFTVTFTTTHHEFTNEFLYPYLDEVMEEMVKANNSSVKILLEKAIRHNEETYQKLCEYKGHALSPVINISKRHRLIDYRDCLDRQEHKLVGMTTNIFRVSGKSESVEIAILCEKLNSFHKLIVSIAEEDGGLF